MEGGRWGLVIVASAFFIQVFAFGLSTSVGVYNIEFLDYFDDDTVGVSLISAINWAVFLGSGPLSSFLMTKFSFRKITLLGSAMVSVGIFLMPFLPYIPSLCLCFGVLAGLGSCFVYVPSHVLSGLYYERHQSLSTGIATSGSGLGGAIMPVVIGKLIEYYGWKGSLIFMAGLELHLFIFSALLRPPPAPKKSTDPPLLELNSVDKKGDLDLDSTNDALAVVSTSQTEVPRASLAVAEETEEVVVENSCGLSEGSVGGKGVDQNGTSPAPESEDTAFIGKTESAEAARPDPDPGSGSGELVKVSGTGMKQGKVKKKKLLNIYLFTDLGFNVYFLSSIFWNATGACYLAFGPEKMAETGISALNSAFLLTVFGMGNFVGGVIGGLIGNVWVDHRITQYSCANIALGVCAFVFPFGRVFDEFAAILVCAGLSFGVVLGLLVVVLIDLIGTENLSDGLGYIMLANGIGAFAGPALTGLIRREYGSYDYAFYLAGLLGVLAGAVMWLIPLISYLFPATNTGRSDCKGYRYDGTCSLYNTDLTPSVCAKGTESIEYFRKETPSPGIQCQNGGQVVKNKDDTLACQCNGGYVGDFCQRLMLDCTEGLQSGHYPKMSGIYKARPLKSPGPISLYCDSSAHNLILKRWLGNVTFNVTMKNYVTGFGKVGQDFWLGLENFHLLTTTNGFTYTLGVQLNNLSSSSFFQHYYRGFRVKGKAEGYSMTFTKSAYASSPATPLKDCFTPLKDFSFSTYDNDNDNNSNRNCAADYGGGWWYGPNCSQCNLVGQLRWHSLTRVPGSVSEVFWLPGMKPENFSPSGVTVFLYRV
ncbi:hypothetical protein ACOMHN_043582 [Nucella lapillus]